MSLGQDPESEPFRRIVDQINELEDMPLLDRLPAMTTAAGLVLNTLDDQDREVLVASHGTLSRVVEDVLFEADFPDALTADDHHRLSALMLAAFVAGYDETAVPEHVESETTQQGRALLHAAYETGQAAADPERMAQVRPLAAFLSSTAKTRLN